jgi:sugar/nucleoside kinase (ribokinase family)
MSSLDRSSLPSVYGVGLIALDLVLSGKSTTPVHSYAGGTCGNVLSILAYLGWEAYPVGRLDNDAASQRVKADMRSWGVKLDFTGCEPTSSTPIIIQEIREDKNGLPKHRFSWACPHCGSWLPAYKPILKEAAETISLSLDKPKVLFIDRLSRGAIILASKAASLGALVVFEPSANSDDKLLAEMLQIAHILKYAEERFEAIDGAMNKGSAVLLEIKTLGKEGLQFRHKLNGQKSGWTHFSALKAPVMKDTCGAGDWCTAGIISQIGCNGKKGFDRIQDKALSSAIRYGQALAAWNCGFEGARGGMYAIKKPLFCSQIKDILEGKGKPIYWTSQRSKSTIGITCPSCPPSRGLRQKPASKIEMASR